MPRITDTELDRLKASVPVADLVAADGVELSRQGADLAGPVPVPRRRAAVAEGDARQEPLALLRLRRGRRSDRLGDEAPRCQLPPRRRAAAERTGAAGEPASSAAAAAPAAPARLAAAGVAGRGRRGGCWGGWWTTTTRASSAARRRWPIWKARGIADPAAIDTFKLGFSDRTLGLRLPDKRQARGRRAAGAAGAGGAVSGERARAFLRLAGDAGAGRGRRRCAEVYGRKITDGLRAGTPLHLYLPGPHRGRVEFAGVAPGGGRAR